MDTSKAIGVIITNPKLRSRLERVLRTYKEALCSYHRSTYNSRNSSRGYNQLCYHRCREKEKVCMCGPT